MDRHDNFASFDNNAIPPDKPRRLPALLRIVLALVILLGLLGLAAYLKPDYFSVFTRYDVRSVLEEFFGADDQGHSTTRPAAVVTPGGQKVTPELHREFTDEQIERARREVLESKKKELEGTEQGPAAGSRQSGAESVPLLYEYEIELFTGGRIFTDNAEVTADAVYYEDGKGLQITLARSEIKRMVRRVKPGKNPAE